MIPLLVSIILGFLCFIFVANLYQVRLPRAPEIEKRLESIKKSNDEPNNAIISDFITMGTEFKFGFLGKYLKNFKPAEFLKDQLYYAGLDIQVDVFILISALCAFPFFLIAAFTTPYCILPGIFAIDNFGIMHMQIQVQERKKDNLSYADLSKSLQLRLINALAHTDDLLNIPPGYWNENTVYFPDVERHLENEKLVALIALSQEGALHIKNMQEQEQVSGKLEERL